MCTYEKNMAGLWKITKDAVELLSEQVVTENNAVDLAKVASIQAMAIFNDNQGWVRHVINKIGDIIETKPVGGVFKSAGTSISRGFIDIDMDADKLFTFFISPEGYGLIDPDSRPEEQAKYLQRFEGFKQNIPGAKLEVANSFLQLPIVMKKETKDREYVILNMHDPSRRLFTSNSMLHTSRPGGSSFQNIVPESKETTRILNTFALHCVPTGPNKCRVSTTSWTDVATGNAKLEDRLIQGWWAPYFERLRKLAESTRSTL